MRQLMALIISLTTIAALTSVAVAAPVGEIRLSVYCTENPERTLVINNTNEPVNLSGWTLGSIHNPISGEPFPLLGFIPAGGAVTYESGSSASGNILTSQFIYNDTEPTEGARLTTSFGTVETLCSQGSNSLAVTGGEEPPAPSTQERPLFESLTPAPFSTVAPGAVRLAVTAYADTDLAAFSLQLNGVDLQPEIGGPTAYLQSAFTERTLAAGTYTLTASATDAEGDTLQAQWDFVVAADPAETAWFTASGQPKADAVNATMRSLVEAFRWHLYGLSWDGANHPELPTHVGLTGQAPALESWVSGTTFNQAATTATLRSLVEAFRWHFYGQDWDPPYPPGPAMPTHAVSFSGPEPIAPWFTASGTPIPENIEATLRSLVESFRWHFWGYSWDGSQHFEIPTHAYQ